MSSPAPNYSSHAAETQQIPATQQPSQLHAVPEAAPAPQSTPPSSPADVALGIGIIALILAAVVAGGAYLFNRSSPETAFKKEAPQLVKSINTVAEDVRTPDDLANAADDIADLKRDVKTIENTGQEIKDPAYKAVSSTLADAAEELANVAEMPRKEATPEALESAQDTVDQANDAISEWNTKHAKADAAIPELSTENLFDTQAENHATFKKEVAARNAERAAARRKNRNTSSLRQNLRHTRDQFKSITARYQAARNATDAWASSVKTRWWNDLTIGDFAGLQAQISTRESLRNEVNQLASQAPASVRPELVAYAGMLDYAVTALVDAYNGMTATESLFTRYLIVMESPEWATFSAKSSEISGRVDPARRAAVQKINSQINSMHTQNMPPPITE